MKKLTTCRDVAQVNFPDMDFGLFCSDDDCKKFIFDQVSTPSQMSKLLNPKPEKKQKIERYSQKTMCEVYEEASKYCYERNNMVYTPFLWQPYPRWAKALKNTATAIFFAMNEVEGEVATDLFYHTYRDLVIWGFDYFLKLSRKTGSTFVFTPQSISNNINSIISHKKANRQFSPIVNPIEIQDI